MSDQREILDHEMLLGLPEIHALGLSAVPRGSRVCVMRGSQIVGYDCGPRGPARASLTATSLDIYTEELNIMLKCFQDNFASKALSTIKCEPVKVLFTGHQALRAKTS